VATARARHRLSPTVNEPERFDFVVLGGGFFGCCLALQLRELRPGCSIVLLERERQVMTRASYRNQARIHQGYHYPRSLLTAYRSRVNFARFVEDFSACVHSSFDHYYGIATIQSRINAAQFRTFCERIGAPLSRAPDAVRDLLDTALVEDVYAVEEPAFDAAILRDLLRSRLDASGVALRLGWEADRVERATGHEDGILVHATELSSQRRQRLHGAHVFACTYSNLNTLLAASGIDDIALKQELTEIALIEMPPELRGLGFTVMCGPFFSVMPFPDRGCHSLYHVRYARHASWFDGDVAASSQEILDEAPPRSNFPKMIKDASRYLPALAHARFLESSWEIRSLLPSSEIDDSRPILFRQDVGGIPNLVCVLGGKIDNVYDLQDELVKYL
jgi:glycine/D-amino acid oxidase-like deaminating enzyme